MDEGSVGLELLVAERAIERTIHRYCRGIDRLLPEVVRSCFHDDAVDDHGGTPRDRDAFVDWVFGLLATYGSTMHLIGTVLVDVDVDEDGTGEVALAETYGVAFHRGPEGEPFEPRRNLITGFRYVDRFERRAGRWAIAHRVATTEWSRVDDLAGRWAFPDTLRRGARDATDPIHWLVPEVTDR
jgi:hypothetical protein